MTTCFAVIAALPELGGANLIPFLAYFLIASVAYWAAVLRLEGGHPSLWMIWVFAVVFRLVLLAAAPSLSSDVYRYLWDGHLLSRGINPYALPVNSPILDAYTTPLRGLVNHNEMASPYLPAAQLLFAAVEKIAPQNPKAFQVLAVTLDLSTGWLLMDLLRMLGLPRRRVLIYLWNPLVIVEFAVGAHLDAWMIFLTVAAFWLVIWAGLGGSHQRGLYLASAVPMAMATLTKAVPVLLAPLFLRRWGWKGVVAFMAIVVGACALFAAGAGWGLVGPLDGTGLFGAVRIFIQRWNYNSGLYHSLEVFLTGFHTPGAVPLEPAYQASIRLARVVTTACMGIATLGAGIWAWRLDGSPGGNYQRRSLNLLRLAVVSLGAYLWFTHTVHPWYVTIILPFIIFLFPAPGEKTTGWRFAYPWLYYSCAVAVSYLTYIDPQNLREFYLVRRIEYLPFYLLLVWAAWPSAYQGLVWIWANGMRWGRMKRR
jgi:alpha-1,6-mannosyltransferase